MQLYIADYKVGEEKVVYPWCKLHKKHPVWVCIQNAVYKWTSLLILLKYDAPVLNLF